MRQTEIARFDGEWFYWFHSTKKEPLNLRAYWFFARTTTNCRAHRKSIPVGIYRTLCKSAEIMQKCHLIKIAWAKSIVAICNSSLKFAWAHSTAFGIRDARTPTSEQAWDKMWHIFKPIVLYKAILDPFQRESSLKVQLGKNVFVSIFHLIRWYNLLCQNF